jgi:hypothetical protein
MARRRLRFGILAALLLASALGACVPLLRPREPYAGPFASLDETYWRLVATADDVKPPAHIEIRFEWNVVDINSDCIFSGLSLRGTPDNVTFADGKIQNGGMAGDDCRRNDSVFDAFLNKLRATTVFAVDGDRLAFRDPAGRAIATFQRVTDLGFEYRDLQVVSFRHGVRMVTARALPYGADVRFFHGDVEGSPGCGGMFGRYGTTATDTIHVSTTWIMMGGADCDSGYPWNGPPYPAMYNALFDDLNGDHKVEVAADGTVTLRDLDGDVSAVLVPVPP